MSKDISGAWMVLAAAVLWGTTGTASALAPDQAAPLAVGAARMVIGGGVLLGLGLARGLGRRLTGWPLVPLLLVVVGTTAYQVTFFSAVARTGVAAGTLVAIGSAPVMAGLLDWLANGQAPHPQWVIATGLAGLGCALLILGSAGAQVRLETVGFLLAALTGLSYAVSTLANKRLVAAHQPDDVMALVFGLAAVISLPLLLMSGTAWLITPSGAGAALHLGLVTTALAYTLFGRGLVRVSGPAAVTLSLAEPLTAASLGLLLLGERLTWLGGLGALTLLAGLALIALPVDQVPAGLRNKLRIEREDSA